MCYDYVHYKFCENNTVYLSYKYVGGGSGQAQNFQALEQAVSYFTATFIVLLL